MSDVEWAGSVDTSSTRRARRLAASANAEEPVVLPTPPCPPKKSTWRSSRWIITGSTARETGERRARHPHPAMPLMEVFEEVRVDLEQIQRRRVGHPGRLHEAQQEEQIA